MIMTNPIRLLFSGCFRSPEATNNRGNQPQSTSNPPAEGHLVQTEPTRHSEPRIHQRSAMQIVLLEQTSSRPEIRRVASGGSHPGPLPPNQDVPGTSSPHSSDNQIPERLQTKLKRAEAEDSPEQRLNHYAEAACRLVRGNVQPDYDMTQLDIENLPTLIATENSRHPELKLRQYTHPNQLLDDLATMPPGSFRALTPLVTHDGRLAQHHVMVSVNKAPGKAPTVVILEPSGTNEITLKLLCSLVNLTKARGMDLSRFAIVEVGAQASQNDCVMFCLNFALKSLKHEAVFEKMHRNIAKGRGPTPNINLKTHLKQGKCWGSAVSVYGTDSVKLFFDKMGYASGPMALPPEFYKHTSSATVARHVLAAAADFAAPARTHVNSDRHPLPESLTERVEAFRVTRRASDSEEPESYSASIEGFRLQEIRRAKAMIGTQLHSAEE